MTIDQLEQEVLKLPAEERARLAERLISSLDSEAEIEREWLAAVQRRDEELESPIRTWHPLIGRLYHEECSLRGGDCDD